jgi:hypothetical protein
MRRSVVFVVAAAVAVVAVGGVLISSSSADTRNVDAFRGLGTWIDVYDFVPAFHQGGAPAPVTGATVDDLAALGVRTIYLQAAIDDTRATGLIVDRRRVASLLQRAHDDGVRVVAWYYVQLVDATRDRKRLDALLDFRASGERFDAIALDIESRQVADLTERNQRLVRLARQVRAHAGKRAIGAIVYPAVQTEVINPRLWPNFPYRKLARSVDVWLPMAYWTYRDPPYRDAFTYTDESVRRLRKDLGNPDAAVHPIGGLAASSTPADLRRLVKAARRVHALGWSIYDADTTATTAWRFLRGDS